MLVTSEINSIINRICFFMNMKVQEVGKYTFCRYAAMLFMPLHGDLGLLFVISC